MSLNKASISSKHPCKEAPRIKASCNGMILVLFRGVLIVANLITKKQLKLSELGSVSLYMFGSTFGFAYDNDAKEHKVVLTGSSWLVECSTNAEFILKVQIHGERL